jgi:hypothetical protein
MVKAHKDTSPCEKNADRTRTRRGYKKPYNHQSGWYIRRKKINNKSKWLSQASLVTNPASGAEAVGGSMEFCGDAKIKSL